MNFTFEQVMDMGFPVQPTAGRYSINNWNFLQKIDEDGWPCVMSEPISDQSSSKFKPLPTVEEVYATLRAGLFLKYVHSAKNGLVFQFWLKDPGFPDKFYASGRDLCEVVCNAYLRSKMSPKNPQSVSDRKMVEVDVENSELALQGFLNRKEHPLPDKKCLIYIWNGGESMLCDWEPYVQAEFDASEGYLGTAYTATTHIPIGYHAWEQNDSEFIYYKLYQQK